MPRNGSGSFTRSVSDYTAGTDILADDMNSEMDDIATALTDSLAKDGQTTPTANLPMGGYRHTGVGNSSARNQYAATGQVQDSAFLWGGTAGGTADARTITPTPAISAYAAGQVFRFINGAAANTGAATLAVSGLTATAIRKGAGATALDAGDLPADAAIEVLFDGSVFRLMAVQPSGIGVTAIRAASVAGFGAVPVAGGTMTGSLAALTPMEIYGAAGVDRTLQFSSNREPRWRIVAESTAESGADAGTNLELKAYADDESLIGNVFVVTRSTRVLDFKVTPTLNGVALSTTTGTITGVTAGTGLTGGGSSGGVTLALTDTYGAVGTYVYAVNNSGGTVTAGSTTSGAGLTPTQSGTWRNMGGDVTLGSPSIWFRTV